MEWEILDGQTVQGPFAEAAVIAEIRKGLPPTTKARPVGKEHWRPIGAHEPFAHALSELIRSPTSPVAARSQIYDGITFVIWAAVLAWSGYVLSDSLGASSKSAPFDAGWVAVAAKCTFGYVVGRSLHFIVRAAKG
ncbi:MULTISPECIES: hypothetical protein [Sorangium]|uniref:GYF domain-containing protein n=1 Tax=Sorangium cellulosum TaxID=56 RepID=A0A4P2QUT9_SORCE|nr:MULTISPECIES: hypothetical protein [Sorangium]AUX33886.1 uncharacterized protein SOCE836_060530 [Sorangium cellulosum]WCQ93196.1 hypothetical protein NQZ70_05944 [Sorangium sp. Soce836]